MATTITLLDRCDGCGAAAQVRYAHMGESILSEIQFCGHHARKHADALKTGGWTVVAGSEDFAGAES